jgi:polyphosphate kinase
MKRLVASRINVVEAGSLSKEDAAYMARHFRESVFPVLTPLAVDPGRPFVAASHLSLNLAVIVRDPPTRREHFACLTIPPVLPRLVALPGGERFVPLERVMAANLRALFPGMEIVGHSTFRLTCDDDCDVPRHPEGRIRLEIAPDMPDELRDLLVRRLLLTPDDVYVVDDLADPVWAELAAVVDRDVSSGREDDGVDTAPV